MGAGQDGASGRGADADSAAADRGSGRGVAERRSRRHHGAPHGRVGAVAEDPRGVEVRALTAVGRAGEEITLVRYRGRPPLLSPHEARDAGRLVRELRRLLRLPQQP